MQSQVISCGALISAYEKGAPWERAKAALEETTAVMGAAHRHHAHRPHRRVRKGQAVGAGEGGVRAPTPPLREASGACNQWDHTCSGTSVSRL